MNFLSEHNFLLIPIFAFCLIAFKYDHKNKLVVTKLKYVLYVLIMMCVLGLFSFLTSYWYVIRYSSLLDKSSQVTEMVHLIEVISLKVANVFFLWNSVFKRKNQVKFLNEIIALEFQIKKLDQLKSYKSLRRVSFKYLTVTATFYAIFFAAKCIFVFTKLLTLFFVSLYYMTCVIYVCMMIIFLLCIVRTQRNLFRVLNNYVMLLKNQRKNESMMIAVLKIHSQLYKTIKYFNESFGFGCLGVMIFIIGDQTCHIYTGPMISLDKNIDFNYDRTSLNSNMNIFWIASIIILFSFLGVECERTQIEAEKLLFVFDTSNFSDINSVVIKLNIS